MIDPELAAQQAAVPDGTMCIARVTEVMLSSFGWAEGAVRHLTESLRTLTLKGNRS